MISFTSILILFTQFYRGKKAASIKTVGAGLDLFISKKIITAYNGSIWFESNVEGETTLYIQLPWEG